MLILCGFAEFEIFILEVQKKFENGEPLDFTEFI